MSAPKLVTLPSAQPVEEVVGLLEKLLEQARAGEIHTVAIAMMYRNEETQTLWAHGPSLRGGLIHSAIGMLLRDWQDRMLEEREKR